MVEEFEKQIEETLELGLTVGCVISEARKKAKLDITQISKELKISKKYLEGIEADDYSSFPGDAYIMGFLKNYANYLGLDSDELFKQLVKEKFSKNKNHVFHKMGQKTKPMKEISKEDLKTDDSSKDSSSKNLIAFFSVTGLILVILILIILNKWIMDFPKSIDKENETVIEEVTIEKENPVLPVLEETTPNLVNIDKIMLEEFSPVEDVKTEPAVITSEEIDTNTETQDIIEETISNIPESVIEEQEPIIEEPESEISIPEVIEETGTTYGSEYIKDSNLTIKVLEESWIEIYNRDREKIVFSGIFAKDDVIIVPNEEDLVMKSGNAGGFKIIYKDQELPPFGKRGAVSDYISLKEKYLDKGIYKSESREDSSWF